MAGGHEQVVETNDVILIAGPTASGKSALALRLAEALDGVVINADSMQLYRELRIVTARPSEADEAVAPHRLYGVLGIDEPCSVGRWLELARAAIAEARQAGRTPIVVGGTGLYFTALTEGLAPVPEVPAAVRERAGAMLTTLGNAKFHRLLAARDPEMAARLPSGDTQRLLRAYEVIEATGRSLADWQRDTPTPALGEPWTGVVLDLPRALLYRRIDERLVAMIDAGAVDEVRRLEAMGLDPGLPAMKALGVPSLRRHARGEIGLDEALREAQTASRRYAKRQLTWFRNKMRSWPRFDTQDSESFSERNFPFMSRVGLTGLG